MKKLIPVILLLSSSSALAEWIYLTQNKLGSSFIDFKGIKKNGSHRKAWTFIVFNEKQQESVLSMKTYDEYDCANDETRNLSMIIYSDKEGVNVVNRFDKKTDFSPVIPDSTLQAALKAICKY
jgi:hypothetical protein